ncbi:MAG: D-tyrosyl-tRNA(Tyr) deacylase [Clostridia bacterium]|nr:D-tyrosyl-tRNA(Tyr) deacylase [Clostridia bacterium]
MRAIVQVTRKSALTVEDKELWSAGAGMVVLLGIAREDTRETADKMIDKLLKLRIFPDENGKINLSALQTGGEIAVISNFTLYANCAASRRPDFARAMGYQEARELYAYFLRTMEQSARAWADPAGPVPVIRGGVFGGDMLLEIHNDGPLTVILDSADF